MIGKKNICIAFLGCSATVVPFTNVRCGSKMLSSCLLSDLNCILMGKKDIALSVRNPGAGSHFLVSSCSNESLTLGCNRSLLCVQNGGVGQVKEDISEPLCSVPEVVYY